MTNHISAVARGMNIDSRLNTLNYFEAMGRMADALRRAAKAAKVSPHSWMVEVLHSTGKPPTFAFVLLLEEGQRVTLWADFDIPSVMDKDQWHPRWYGSPKKGAVQAHPSPDKALLEALSSKAGELARQTSSVGKALDAIHDSLQEEDHRRS